jgi:hypothetical protein
MAMHRPPLLDAPPMSDQLTAYDYQHFPTYMFLLDWADAGCDWRHAMVQLVGAEVTADPIRVKEVYDAHLARARWMTVVGWRLLLQEDGHEFKPR